MGGSVWSDRGVRVFAFVVWFQIWKNGQKKKKTSVAFRAVGPLAPAFSGGVTLHVLALASGSVVRNRFLLTYQLRSPRPRLGVETLPASKSCFALP